jgi:hypothetical protein
MQAKVVDDTREATMAERTMTVTIPEMLYLQLEAAARSSAQPIDAVITQALERTIPPHLTALLSSTLRTELEAMDHLSDDALRTIAYGIAPSERGAQMDDLIALKQDGTITTQQQDQLTVLREESEAFMVRKAHAFVLLKSRGHTLPTIDQLPAPVA